MDYAAAREPALASLRGKKPEQALEAFRMLSETARNDHQRADALEHAAMAALALELFDEALALAREMPLRPRSRTVQMRLLARQQQWQAIRDGFAEDDFAAWPRSTAAEAFYLRGAACRQLGDTASALRDWIEAGRRTEEAQVFFDLGNLAQSLNEDVIAMDAYRNTLRALPDRAGWQYYTAVVARARILLRNGFHTLALQELEPVGEEIGGYWRVQVLTERGRALAALGERERAEAVFRAALATEGIYEVQRNTLAKLLEGLKPNP